MRKTVFVVGAGASTEFNLGVRAGPCPPIQELLRYRVSTPHTWLNERSDPFWRAICALESSAEDIVSAAETIRRGLPLSNSIDDFLNENSENSLVIRLGKLAIARCMLDQGNNANWLKQFDSEEIQPRAEACAAPGSNFLFRMLKRAHSSAQARDAFSAISFIVFNYDRCIEHFCIQL